MNAPAFDMKVRDLAEKIYVELVRGVVAASKEEIRVGADPVELAKASFALAASFHAVQDDLNTANLPKNQDYKVDIADFAKWNK